jgi:hypothetical protein
MISHSPTTSRHRATEHLIVSKLVRFMTLTVVSCRIERNRAAVDRAMSAEPSQSCIHTTGGRRDEAAPS